MSAELNKSIFEHIETDTPLTEADKDIIYKLSSFNSTWIAVSDALIAGRPIATREELLSWMRRQSVNGITQVEQRKLTGITLIKTWVHDPTRHSIFFTFSPYLYDRTGNSMTLE